MDKFLEETQALRSNIRVVLVEPSHMGNIGAAARAMWVMGLDQLYLVRCAPLTEVARQRAAGALHVLEHCQHCEALPKAVEGCRWVVATSARIRAVEWPLSTPKQAAKQLVEHARSSPVAILFGPEASGLKSQDLQLANEQVVIPSSSIYGSLNLAMALQILTYEIFQALKEISMAAQPDLSEDRESLLLAHQGSLSNLQAILEDLALSSEFLHAQDLERVLSQIKVMFLRMRPTQREMNILIGLLKKVLARLPRSEEEIGLLPSAQASSFENKSREE